MVWTPSPQPAPSTDSSSTTWIQRVAIKTNQIHTGMTSSIDFTIDLIERRVESRCSEEQVVIQETITITTHPMSGSAQGLFLKSPFARTGLYSGHSVDQLLFSTGTETELIHVDILINESANEESFNLSKVLRQDMKNASYQKRSNQVLVSRNRKWITRTRKVVTKRKSVESNVSGRRKNSSRKIRETIST